MHTEGLVALLIPILFVIGLFTAISLNIYFKNRTKSIMYGHFTQGCSPADLARVEAEAKTERIEARTQRLEARAQYSRDSWFRVGGFLAGAGIGTAIGCLLMPCLNGIFAGSWVDETAWFVFLILAIALFFGGIGIIGSHFVQKALDGKVGTPTAK